jgi:6-phosphogluconate dehydrogenase
MAEHEIGVVGLATMGENLARNLASHEARVVVYNRTRKRTDDFMAAHSASGDFRAAGSLEELARILQPPRAILLMVKAGSAVDDAVASLVKVRRPGDALIDGGNSLFHDTRRRAAAVEKAGLGFIGAGVSGGEEGAPRTEHHAGRHRASYERVAEMLTAISAKVDGTPCCTYIGPDGAGHPVKMVHNGSSTPTSSSSPRRTIS